MRELEKMWRETKARHSELEEKIVENYISFLQQVAKHYLGKGRRVFFRENRVVHWGEGNFGHLLIKGDEEVTDVFGDYVTEISFDTNIRNHTKNGYVEIGFNNLNAVSYKVDKY